MTKWMKRGTCAALILLGANLLAGTAEAQYRSGGHNHRHHYGGYGNGGYRSFGFSYGNGFGNGFSFGYGNGYRGGYRGYYSVPRGYYRGYYGGYAPAPYYGYCR